VRHIIALEGTNKDYIFLEKKEEKKKRSLFPGYVFNRH
jgi:transcription antitermination factor NusG